MRRLVRLRNAIVTRKKECEELEGRIGALLCREAEGAPLSQKLARLEALQLQRIELQSRKETLLRENEEMQQLIDCESHSLLASVELMERVQTVEMRRVLELSVVLCDVTARLQEQYVQLKRQTLELKATLVAQLKRVFVVEKRVDPKLHATYFALNGVSFPTRVPPNETDLANEMYGDMCHLLHLLARYFDIALKYPLAPNAMFSSVIVRGARRDAKATVLPLFTRNPNSPNYRLALTYLAYDADQILLFFGKAAWQSTAQASLIEKVFNIFRCSDEHFAALARHTPL